MSTTQLPRRWFTAGTNLDAWGDSGTYKAIPYEALPPLPPVTRDGSFAWLRAEPTSPHGLDFGDVADDLRASVLARLDHVIAEAKAEGLVVPRELVTFLLHPELHARVPSCTACYLDVPARLARLPGGGEGRLLRFLNDQQCCLLWYVHLLPGGGHQVICAAPHFDDEKTGETIEDVAELRDPVVCATSFEEFIERFWLENALWFASSKRAPLTAVQQAYASAAKKAAATL